MALLCNDVSHWLGTNLESALVFYDQSDCDKTWHIVRGYVHSAVRCLTTGSHEISESWDIGVDLSDRSEIWQVLQQQCCWSTCQISEWSYHDIPILVTSGLHVICRKNIHLISAERHWAPCQNKGSLPRSGDFHYKNKMVIRPSYIYYGNYNSGKMTILIFILRQAPDVLTCISEHIRTGKDTWKFALSW